MTVSDAPAPLRCSSLNDNQLSGTIPSFITDLPLFSLCAGLRCRRPATVMQFPRPPPPRARGGGKRSGRPKPQVLTGSFMFTAIACSLCRSLSNNQLSGTIPSSIGKLNLWVDLCAAPHDLPRQQQCRVSETRGSAESALRATYGELT